MDTLHSEFSKKSSILKVCKTIKCIKSLVEQDLKSFLGRYNFLKPPVFRFTNSLPYSLKESRELKILIRANKHIPFVPKNDKIKKKFFIFLIIRPTLKNCSFPITYIAKNKVTWATGKTLFLPYSK